jgi:SAM-dependent methyltransferase
MWESAPWERVAPTMADIHDRLITLLKPKPGERWLDVGTGTGAVAIRAARAGAAVTAQDLTPALIETAKRLAAEGNLSITFEVGDAEQMPYEEASFDVVSSAHGVVFAPDHRKAAVELARVCRPGGRLGLTAWRSGGAGDEFDRLVSRFEPPKPPGLSPGSWGEERHAIELLGNWFELEFFPEVWIQKGESGQAIWELLTTASPPFKALADSLEPERREELRLAWVDYFEDYRVDGGIEAPNEYTVILGRRTSEPVGSRS